MQVLFEESGGFKVGVLLNESEAAVQVEVASGRRLKVKKAHVLLRFEAPDGADVLSQANAEAKVIDPAFLWECLPEGEFCFLDFAREYVGKSPAPVEAATVLLAVHNAPLYFHRRGKGRYRRAPVDILQAALAGQARKALQAEMLSAWSAKLQTGKMPPEIAAISDQLLGSPDRNMLEVKAFEDACAQSGRSPASLLLHCGAFSSPYALHYQSFLLEYFPGGVRFPPVEALSVPDLPLAKVAAFSIDDALTTEIDDAFSVTPLSGGAYRIGIHIAAPGLGFDRQHPVHALARARLSTVYLPGDKITMLPMSVVEAFSLDTHQSRPSLSLYITVDKALDIVRHESLIEAVPVVANLRHHEIEPLFNEQSIEQGLQGFDFADELLLLWRFANACAERRGKPSTTQGLGDFNFHIDGDLGQPEHCRVSISERPRGSPLDTLVGELMILVNSTWGGLLAERGVAGMFRAQVSGKTRMSVHPQPHEGLGVAQYAWSTSPLRRYADLLNQWQLIAVLQDLTPPFSLQSPEILAALKDFEIVYAAYSEFQRRMERYWSLVWLKQENVQTASASVRYDHLVQLEGLPLLLRLPSLPNLPQALPGRRVRVALREPDLVGLELEASYMGELDALDTPDPTAADTQAYTNRQER